MWKLVSRVMLFLLVTCVLALAFETRTARADGTVYINADGSITPANAPISTLDNVTYTFTGNINESVIVQRNNTVIDGAGHTVQGSGSGNGIDLESVNNVMVENVSVNDFGNGILLNSCYNSTVLDNSLTWNGPYGIYLNVSSNNTVYDNYASGSYVAIYLYNCSNNTLSGNTAVENDQGIVLDSSNNNTLSDDYVTQNPAYGIALFFSSYNLLSGNNVLGNAGLGGSGIYLSSSSHNTLSSNNATENYWNIVLDSSSDNVLIQNVFNKSFGTNFLVYGSTLSDYVNWVDASNLINGKPVYYLVNQNGLQIDSSTHPSIGYLALVNCTNITVENVTLPNDNGQGALFAYTTNSTIMRSYILGGDSGIYLYSSSNDTVSDNYITGNQWGIYIDSSSNNMVTYDNVTGNGDGMLLTDDSNDTISCNNVTGNPGGIGLISSFNDTLSHNTVARSTSWGIMQSGSHNTLSGNNITQNNYQGIELWASFDDILSCNNVTGNYGDGIYVDIGCFNETVVSNTVSGNSWYGITIWTTWNNTTVGTGSGAWPILSADGEAGDATDSNSWANSSVLGNDVTGNAEAGIALVLTSGNNVSGNDVVGNGQGFLIDHSSNNTIYHNNIINNTQQAVISGSEPNTWDDGYPSGGNYWSDYSGTDVYSGPYQNVTGSDGIGDIPYVIDANNTDHYPLVVHDLAVTGIVPSKTVVGRGYSLNITVTAADLGNIPEIFNVSVYANTTPIASDEVTLQRGNSVQITFTWNITALAYGNYTISAYAWPVQNETNTGSNNMTGGIVCVSIPGDINGDGTVNKFDAIILGNAFGATPASPNWNPNADINGDGTVDIYDAIILASHYGQSIP